MSAPDDMDIARARAVNRSLVRMQREDLGLRVERESRKGKGVCRVVIETASLLGMDEDEEDAAMAQTMEAVKKKIRDAVAEKGGIVDTIVPVKLLNGDIEVRCEFTVKRKAGG